MTVPSLRKYVPDEAGYVITDKATETMRANPLYLGKEADENDYFDILDDTPVPEPENFDDMR